MAVLHVIRSGLYLARGWYDRARLPAAKAAQYKGTPAPSTSTTSSTPIVTVEQQPAFLKNCLSCATDVTAPIFMGFRMADAFGHVNNARYLEAFEFGRWYQMAFNGLDSRSLYAGIYPVVSSVSMQFIREIKPFQWVVCRTKGPFNVADDRTLKFVQQLESKDGKTIYATASIRVCMLNMPFKSPTGALGKSMQITKRGIIPPDELLNRCFCFEEERRVANKYRARSSNSTTLANKGSDNNNANGNDGGVVNEENKQDSDEHHNHLFDSELMTNLNHMDAAWRSDVIQRAKELKESGKKK